MNPKLTQPEEVEHVLKEMTEQDMKNSDTGHPTDIGRILTNDFFALFACAGNGHAKPTGRIE